MNPQPHILQHIFRVSAAAHLASKKSIELRAEHYDQGCCRPRVGLLIAAAVTVPEPPIAKPEIEELRVLEANANCPLGVSAIQQANTPRVGTLPVTGTSVPPCSTR